MHTTALDNYLPSSKTISQNSHRNTHTSHLDKWMKNVIFSQSFLSNEKNFSFAVPLGLPQHNKLDKTREVIKSAWKLYCWICNESRCITQSVSYRWCCRVNLTFPCWSVQCHRSLDVSGYSTMYNNLILTDNQVVTHFKLRQVEAREKFRITISTTYVYIL